MEFEAVAAEVELQVQRQAGVAARENEAISSRPGGIGRVVAQELLEEQVESGRQAYCGARVA